MMTGDNPAYDFDLAVERVRAAASAARALGRPFVFCARADGVMNGVYDTDEAIRRIRAFEAAGADLLYVPLPPDMDSLKRVVDSVSKPVNALAAGPYVRYSVDEFAASACAASASARRLPAPRTASSPTRSPPCWTAVISRRWPTASRASTPCCSRARMTIPDGRLTRIDDPDDPRIETYRDIRERDLVRRGLLHRRGQDGAAGAGRAGPVPGPLAAGAGKPDRGHCRHDRGAARDVPVYCAAQPVMDAIAGFHMHRGVLAAAAIPEGIAALPERAAGLDHRARPFRHFQSRQYGRHLPQRRRLRRRRRADRSAVLRPALSQGDPRLGRRRAARAVLPRRLDAGRGVAADRERV